MIEQLQAERYRIDEAIKLLSGSNSTAPTKAPKAGRKKRNASLSADGRKRISEAIKKWWAAAKKKLKRDADDRWRYPPSRHSTKDDLVPQFSNNRKARPVGNPITIYSTQLHRANRSSAFWSIGGRHDSQRGAKLFSGEMNMACERGYQVQDELEKAVLERTRVEEQYPFGRKSNQVVIDARSNEETALLNRTIHVSGCSECRLHPPQHVNHKLSA